MPLIAAYGAFGISVGSGLIEGCIPNLEGCVSISRAARKPPSVLLFRGLMLPLVGVYAVYWWQSLYRLREWNIGSPVARGSMLAAGLAAALGLAVHLSALGVEGDGYRMLRRLGTNLSLLGMLVAQAVQALLLWRARRGPLPHQAVRGMLGTLLGQLLLILAVLVTAPFWGTDKIDRAAAWNLMVLTSLYFGFAAWGQRSSSRMPTP